MYKQLPPFIKLLEEKDPELFEVAAEVYHLALKPAALDEKTKVLITLALDALKGSEQGVALLAKRAREIGVTEEEISEALRLAYMVAGIGPLVTGTAAYRE